MPKRFPHCDRRTGLAAIILASALAGAFPAWADPSQTTSSNTIDTSVNSTQGVVDINQQAGDSNNQGNITSIAASGALNSAAIASVIASQEQQDGSTDAAPVVETNTINNSFNGSQGIAQVSQVAGHGNDQLNIVAIAFAPGASFSPALTDVELQQVRVPSASSSPSSVAPGSDNVMNNSFDNFRGIAQVSQIAGDSNIVTSVVAVAIGGGG